MARRPVERQVGAGRRHRTAAGVLLCLVLVGSAALADDTSPVIPAGREAVLLDLIADVGFNAPLDGGLTFDSASVDRATAIVRLRTQGGGDAQPVAAEVLILHRTAATQGDTLTQSLALRVTVLRDDPVVRRHVDALLRSIAARDKGDLYALPRGVGPSSGPAVAAFVTPMKRAAGVLLPLLLVVLLAMAWRRRLPSVTFTFKITHVLPAAIQLAIYAYWGLYYPALVDFVPQVVIQLAFAFCLDATLSLLRWGAWRATFGPIPVVLSTGLFVQFSSAHWLTGMLAIAVAIGSRALVRREAGPVFNPSALGISVVGVLNYVFPALGFGDIALAFNAPPNMAEVLVLLALIVQVRLPVVLVTIGAAVGLLLHDSAAIRPVFEFTWAPVTLVLLLLATDPITSPRTGGGRLLFGLLVGLMMGFLGEVLELNGISDFYAKVIPIPVANLLVPWLDRLGARLDAQLPSLRPRWNLAHVALWLCAFTAYLFWADTKRATFRGDFHARAQTPLVQADPDGSVTCSPNPIFCEPFSFPSEVAAWLGSTSP